MLDNLTQVSVQIQNKRKILYFREESTSDMSVIDEIVFKGSYDISNLNAFGKLKDYYCRHSEGSTPLIIDAGANIGIASIWFCTTFSSSKVIAIEPEEKNFNILELNTKNENIICLKGAIASKNCRRSLFDPGNGEWSYRIVENNLDSPISCFSLDYILKKVSGSECVPFIFKIDIEGGESDLFSRNFAEARRFPLLMIELHDWMLPGESNSKNFFRFIGGGNYDIVFRNELIFAFNNDLL